MYACIHVPGTGRNACVTECARAFSPRVEQTAPGTVVLDIRGLERLIGSPRDVAWAIADRLGLPASIAVARNPDAALHAARGRQGVTVIPPGEEAQRLAALPLEILEPPPEMAEILARWGLRTFGDLAALPEEGLSQRLGPEGVRLQKLARGAASRLLRPDSQTTRLEASMDWEHPLSELEPLGFILARLLSELCAEMASRGRATNEIRLRLRLENGEEQSRRLELPFPTRDHRACWKLLQLDLESRPPRAPLLGIRIEVQPVDPRVVQDGLFTPPSPEPEKLELTLTRIAGLVGTERVGSAELVDTHRPGAFRMKRFAVGGPASGNGRPGCRLALRVFRPPLEARVDLAEGRPRRVEAPSLRATVLAAAGPWRSSGDWWTRDPWARDEWDLALSDGSLCRLYRDRLRRAWFVAGIYD